jgi:hypothetical protein
MSGCHPTLRHNLRAATVKRLLNRKASTVARPTEEIPWIKVPESSQAKCAFQASRLGSKSGTTD